MRYRVILVCALVIGGGHVFWQSGQSPEQVVQAFAKAWGEGKPPALLALFAEDARGYDRALPGSHGLVGKLSDSIGSKDRLAAYYTAAAAKPLSSETIVASATVGELVIASGESVPSPNGAPMSFLTAYRVRGGQIHDLWHLAWTRADPPARRQSLDVIERLVAAREKRDADAFLALFDRGARHFRPANDPRVLTGTPSDTLVDEASRDQYVRRRFADGRTTVRTVKIFAVGDLAVVQSHTTGFAGAPDRTMTDVSIYRIREGLIVDCWVIGEESLATPLSRPLP